VEEYIMANIISTKDFLNSKDFLTPIQNSLIKTLEEEGPLTRRDLVKHLITPRTTVYDNLIKLHKRKLVAKFTRSNGKRGRPLVLWKLNE
jgi:predicted ArsR family transcriptional regulator